MKEWEIGEVARRLHQQIQEDDTHVVWFLGAGCSITSGIPGAGQLVQKWMEELKGLKQDAFDPWVAKRCPDWEAAPAAHYGLVIDERFGGNPRARQEEIARLVREKEPGFGYACLAQLMTHADLGRRNNLAFTTNFDDLIADAMYLYTLQKPLTVVHEALSGFLRSSEVTPLVVKLHGDAQLAPKNTTSETNELAAELTTALREVLRDTVFVFLGYGGNDQSIATFLRGCPRNKIAGAYWVNPDLPGNDDFRDWLVSLEGAVHVDHLEFDSFMAELHAEFDLGIPDFDRFVRLQDGYRTTAERLMGASDRGTASAERALTAMEAWKLDEEARALGDSDPERRENLHREAIKAQPKVIGLITNYALFLDDQGRHADAEAQYLRAIEVNPAVAGSLNNYAVFLKKHDRLAEAEDLYKRSIEVDPTHANSLGNYAVFLKQQGQTVEAEAMYHRAIDANPTHPNNLSNYANFLQELNRPDESETMHERAIAADPNSLNLAANHTRLLLAVGRADAVDRLRSLLESLRVDPRGDVWIEALVYAFILDLEDAPVAVSSELKRRLLDGERSKGWDFTAVLDRFETSSADPDLARAVAAVASDAASIDTLDSFEGWKAIETAPPT